MMILLLPTHRSKPDATGRWSRVSRLRRLAGETDGAAMLETIIIAPVVLIFLAGILEFGALLFYKVEFETGLRDAARYLARCQDNPNNPAPSTVIYGCTVTAAQNIAVYASKDVPSPGSPRVVGWQPSDVVVDSPAPILISNPVDPLTGDSPYRGPAQIYVVRVSSTISYPGGPLLGLIGFASIPMTAFHEERFIGW